MMVGARNKEREKEENILGWQTVERERKKECEWKAEIDILFPHTEDGRKEREIKKSDWWAKDHAAGNYKTIQNDFLSEQGRGGREETAKKNDDFKR